MRRLVLFDIDGTLLTDGGAAREAFGDALRAVYGYERDLAPYDFSGRTDPQIAFMVLRDAGFSDDAIAAAMPRLWEHYLAGLARNASVEGRVRALPGIREVLAILARRDDVTLALLTGNIERGARLKLAAAGLDAYFPFGAFGSDSQHREELPPVAVQRAGRPFAPRDVVIIGDSIYDVRCGTPHDATTIAVASGKTPAERLKGENPTFLFASAEEEGFVEAIVGA